VPTFAEEGSRLQLALDRRRGRTRIDGHRTGRGPGRGARKTLRMKLWLGGAVAVLLGATPAVAQAIEPASTYDTDGQEHNDVCVESARGPSLARGPFLDLRHLSGLATGFQLLRITPEFDPGSKCVRGQIRLDLHEVVAAPSATQPRGVLKDGLVFHRGGSDYVDADNVRYGQLAVSELKGTSPADLAQVNGSVEARYVQTQVGDGAPVYGWMVWTHQYYYDDSDNYIGPELAPVVNHFTTG
jgi:hypothetical protein